MALQVGRNGIESDMGNYAKDLYSPVILYIFNMKCWINSLKKQGIGI